MVCCYSETEALSLHNEGYRQVIGTPRALTSNSSIQKAPSMYVALFEGFRDRLVTRDMCAHRFHSTE